MNNAANKIPCLKINLQSWIKCWRCNHEALSTEVFGGLCAACQADREWEARSAARLAALTAR